MFNITIRNIPDEIIEKIRVLSEMEKRSLNNEILILLEKGLLKEMKIQKRIKVSKEAQIRIWEKLSGEWEDKRSTIEIIEDIYSNRDKGREIRL